MLLVGTTWLSAIVPLVLNDGDEEKVDAMGHMTANVPYVEIHIPGFPTVNEILTKEKSTTCSQDSPQV